MGRGRISPKPRKPCIGAIKGPVASRQDLLPKESVLGNSDHVPLYWIMVPV